MSSAGTGSAGEPADAGVPDGGGGFFGPIPDGHWRFDDCSAASTLLIDSSESGAHATRTASVQCAPGIDELAVRFDERRDSVDVPAHEALSFSDRLTVATWVNPAVVTSGTLVTKQPLGRTVFELALDRGNARFGVDVAGRGTITTRAPIARNAWTHVAGVFDGTFVRLFLNGEQWGQVAASGDVNDALAPLRLGNNARTQFLNGHLDEVFVSSAEVTPDDIRNLSCIRKAATMVVTPRTSGPVDPETTVDYDIAVTNNDFGGCFPQFVFAFPQFFEEGITVNFDQNFADLDPGATVHFTMSVTGTADAEPGARQIPFVVFTDSAVFEDSVEYILNAPVGCFVRTSRELMIRDISVVDDPIRTSFDGPPDDPRTGAWTFGRLLEQLAPTPADAPALAAHLFDSWLADQTINGFTVPARPAIQQNLLDGFRRHEDGSLDLTSAPLRLLAIVNRIDIRDLARGHAGEGRFVFGVIHPQGFAQEFTVILEYNLPATTEADVLDWAARWHALGALPFPSEEYNAALQAVTDRFAGRGAMPSRPNGSALSQLRTNEIALSSPWELREFQLSATTGLLEPATVKLTPDTSFMFDGGQRVADFVNANESSILIERHDVPEIFQGQPFLAGSSFNDLFAWVAPGIANNEARHKFSLNTCNGCHSAEETGTFFLQVFPREVGQASPLSGFLTGNTVFDVVTGEPRQFNDLRRRNLDLDLLVCDRPVAPSTAPEVVPTTDEQPTRLTRGLIRTGIGRVH